MLWISWSLSLALVVLGWKLIPRKQLALLSALALLHPAMLSAVLPCDVELFRSLSLFAFAGIVVFAWGVLEGRASE